MPARHYNRVITARTRAVAATDTLLGRYLASVGKERTRQAYLEGLTRIAALYGKAAESVAWGRLRAENVSFIADRLARTRYSAPTMKIAMVALRGILRLACAEGAMTEAERDAACVGGYTRPEVAEMDQITPWQRRQRLFEEEQAMVRRRFEVGPAS